jgi:hypothetical protein
MTRTAVVLAGLLLASPAFAQAPPPPPGGMPQQSGPAPNQGLIGKGVKAGINLGSIGGDDADGLDGRLAFGAGGFIVYGMGSINLQIEALFMQKGATASQDGFDFTLGYNYLEVPVALRFDIPSGGQMTPYVFGGAAAAVKISASVSAEGDSADLEDVTPFDLGIVAGGGLQFPAGAGQFLVEARYTYGLISIDDSDGDFSVFQRTLSLMGGYSF